MTDLQINKALALAIGWPALAVEACEVDQMVWVCVAPGTLTDSAIWWVFDYQVPGVIWPIAERYGFPSKRFHGSDPKVTWERHMWDEKKRRYKAFEAETAAKCVALAVIGSVQ
jgi:hypothetical protein